MTEFYYVIFKIGFYLGIILGTTLFYIIILIITSITNRREDKKIRDLLCKKDKKLFCIIKHLKEENTHVGQIKRNVR